LNGMVNPNGVPTTYYFEWGTTTSYGNTTGVQSVGSGLSDVVVSANLTGLTRNTTYHYRVVATNSLGTSYGSDRSFIASVNMPWLMLLLGD
jgi:phosphodiesterase/alkaline phosphatase D-like protein